MLSLTIPVDKIREVIGSGGKVIQKLCADYDVKIDIEDDGQVFILGTDFDNCKRAKKWWNLLYLIPKLELFTLG